MSEHNDQERRQDLEMRSLIERAAERGALIALQKLGELTPYDLSTKEGREALRGTINHADIMKIGCDNVKRVAGGAAVKIVIYTSIAGLIIGVYYLFGGDPSKLRFLKEVQGP